MVSNLENTHTVAGLARSIASKPEAETEITRMLRHYSGVALLMPIGAVNTGTGNKRLYPKDAPLRAAILLRLNKFGIPIGVLSQVFKGFDRYLTSEFSTSDLMDASKSLTAPCLFIMLPDEASSKVQRHVQLREITDFEELASRPLVAISLLPIIDGLKEPSGMLLRAKKPIIRLNPK